MNNVQTLKGFRDFLPRQMAIREKVITTFKEVFASFGFDPLQTPTLEYADVLMGKYGEEADKLLYTFEDRGGRKIGLNYDLTVPLARVLTQYQNLSLPFKRYQIQSSYRAENPQKGRYRQFTQCDIDTVGTSSPLADAEIVAVIYTALQKLGFQNFTILLNDRAIFTDLVTRGIIKEEKLQDIIRSIDKLDKVGASGVIEELVSKGYDAEYATSVLQTLEQASPTENLTTVFSYLEKLGVKKENYTFSPTLARGLDYYTSTIYEVVVKDANIGSIAAGGRYDHLIKKLGGPDLPAVGTTLGLDRICDVIEEKNLFDLTEQTSQVLVTIFSPELKNQSLEITSLLRSQNIKTELYLDENAKLEKQLKYADQKGIPFAVIVGTNEIEQEQVVIKNLKTREQKTISIKDLPHEFV